MTRPTPRRPASSRNVTPRPRKLAGQAPTPDEVESPARADETAAPVTGEEVEVPPAAVEVEEPPAAVGSEPEDDGSGPLASDRATRTLIKVLAVLTVVLVLLAAAWASHLVADLVRDDPKPHSVPEGSIDVPSDRPVLPTQLAVEEGVDAAGHAAQQIFALSYRTYDKDVDKAVTLMTPSYADEFRQTAGDVKSAFVKARTTVDVRLRGQGVVRANDTELQAVVFLDQFVTRGKDQKTVISPYRVLMTMVHTDKGWLVDKVDTK